MVRREEGHAHDDKWSITGCNSCEEEFCSADCCHDTYVTCQSDGCGCIICDGCVEELKKKGIKEEEMKCIGCELE